METYEVLNKAADILPVRGWMQYGYAPEGATADGWMPSDGDTPVCMEGAMKLAAGIGVRVDSYRDHYRAKDALTEYLGMFPWVWNDSYAESMEHVIEVLRACAVIEQARADQLAAEATYAENLALVSA